MAYVSLIRTGGKQRWFVVIGYGGR
jgi:hypothetical protein